jgi:hypothetical protein
MTDARPFIGNALRTSGGVMLWALHFLLIYGFTALACERGFHERDWLGAGPIAWVVLGATAVTAAAMIWLMRRLLQAEPRTFVDWLGAALTGLALVGVLYEAVPVLLVKPCV